MPARRNPAHQSNSRSTAKRPSKKTSPPTHYDCFICTSTSQDHPLQTISLNSSTLRAHDVCIRAIPELDAPATSPSTNPTTTTTLEVQNLVNYRKRSSLKCSVCRDDHGLKIQCVAARCARAFHINCASESQDIHFELVDDSSPMPYKLLCRMHNSTRRQNLTAATRRKKEDLITAFMTSVRDGDAVTVKLQGRGRCAMTVVSINHSDRTLDVTPLLNQKDDQIDESTIRTVEWKQVLITSADLPAALTPQTSHPEDNLDAASLEPSPLRPTKTTTTTSTPSRSPSPSAIEWEQELRGIQSALFPTSTTTSSIMEEDDATPELSPSKFSEPISESGSEQPRPTPSVTNSSPSLCSDTSTLEYQYLREGTPDDFESPYRTPSSSVSPQRQKQRREEPDTKTYMPPLYVLNPEEIQRASQAFFTIPSWNDLITEVMEEAAAAAAASS